LSEKIKIQASASPIIRDDTLIWHKFKQLWKYYIWQSVLAGVALFIIALVLGREKVVVISAMGATAFIVFTMPTAASAQTRNVIGGHLVGLAVGTIFYFTGIAFYIEFPLVIAIAIFIMVAFDFEHPPAVGTAIAVLINEVSWDVFATITISAIILSQCRYYLRHHLKNLI
jgi:CBS-domain-containing membrane protein